MSLYSYDIKPQYYSGAVAGCLNGGEDYRTVAKKSVEQDISLMVDPQMSGLSGACSIVKFKISCEYRVTNTSNGSGLTLKGKFSWVPIQTADPVISGTSIGLTGNFPTGSTYVLHGVTDWITMDSERKGNTNYASYSYETTGSLSGLRGHSVIIGGHFAFESLNSTVSCRMWLKNVKYTITRTRACYVFWDTGLDDLKAIRTTCDHGVSPTYNNVIPLSKPGYTFKGWRASDGTVYTSTLPVADEKNDVTYTAVWELDKVNKIYVGTAQPKAIYSGTQEVKGIYLGTTKVYG